MQAEAFYIHFGLWGGYGCGSGYEDGEGYGEGYGYEDGDGDIYGSSDGDGEGAGESNGYWRPAYGFRDGDGLGSSDGYYSSGNGWGCGDALEEQPQWEQPVRYHGTGLVIKNFCKKERKMKIVILQRGWVVVGEFSQNGTECKILNGAVIRRWGTTKGLGQLATEGPTADTILDPIPETTFHELTVIAKINCNAAAWKK